MCSKMHFRLNAHTEVPLLIPNLVTGFWDTKDDAKRADVSVSQ